MSPVRYIRKEIFRQTQAAFAAEFGVAQPSVARWEAAGFFPADVQPAVRRRGMEICEARGEQWSDSWFFEVPAEEAA